MTGKEMTKEEISKAVELMKPIYDIETPIKELMSGHYSLCSYAYNISIELIKYKRAFEILKDYSIIPPLEDFRYSEYTNCYFAEIEEYDHDYEDYRTIHYVLEKDEYELLEELMKDAKD